MAECNRLESGRQGDPLAKGSNPLPSATCLTNKSVPACRSTSRKERLLGAGEGAPALPDLGEVARYQR